MWTPPTMLAPMHGVGAVKVRETLAHLGCPGMICAPFLRITSEPPRAAWIGKQFRRTTNTPFSVQLLGSHPQHLALAAKVLSDAGADVVDLNLGCPTRQAAKKRVGAALLSDADLISRIVTAMRAACHCRLSVKIRIVDSSPDEVLHIAKAVEAAGADFLIVHPRTRHQAYTGVADWSVVKRLKSHLSIPVVGNGDLWYASDALRLMRLSGADAIMLGRPVLRNPFLFRQIEELRNGQPLFVPKGNDIVEYIARLADIFETGKKQARPNNPLKAHVQRVLGAVPEPQRSRVRERALRVTGLAEIFEAIKPLRDVELLDLAADGPFRFETAPSDPV